MHLEKTVITVWIFLCVFFFNLFLEDCFAGYWAYKTLRWCCCKNLQCLISRLWVFSYETVIVQLSLLHFSFMDESTQGYHLGDLGDFPLSKRKCRSYPQENPNPTVSLNIYPSELIYKYGPGNSSVFSLNNCILNSKNFEFTLPLLGKEYLFTLISAQFSRTYSLRKETLPKMSRLFSCTLIWEAICCPSFTLSHDLQWLPLRVGGEGRTNSLCLLGFHDFGKSVLLFSDPGMFGQPGKERWVPTGTAGIFLQHTQDPGSRCCRHLPAHSACHAGGGTGKLRWTGAFKYASVK